MAAFVQTQLISSFDPNNLTSLQRMMRALQNQDTNADAELRKVLGKEQFFIQGTTDTNTAAASSPVVNLSDQGVTFPPNTYRDILIQAVVRSSTNRYKIVTTQRVRGGATDPALEGPTRFLTECNAFYGFTTADGTTTTEDATACIAPEWWDGASPVAGNVASNAFTVQWLGTNSPVSQILPFGVSNHDGAAAAADARSFQHGNVNLTNGTSEVFISDVATPTAANFSNNSVVRTWARIFPPMQFPVLIDTSPTPDKVFIGALGISATALTWQLKVFVGDLVGDFA